MYFNTAKDDYEQGEIGEHGTSWENIREFGTLKEVKEFIRDNTYSGYDYIEQHEEEEGRYRTAYTTTDANEGEMTPRETEDWKAGKINGWTVDCDITVQHIVLSPVKDIKFD